jgi:uncharacterized Ntn-hydrolase superfamily protein
VYNDPPMNTFSIVARDAETGDFGVAVQSRAFAVGANVSWAQASVGAIATQSKGNPTYGRRGLALLQAGWKAQDVVDYLTLNDPLRENRQVGIVDQNGTTATRTGQHCTPWAGVRTGPGYAAQGNTLVSSAVIDAMAETYESTEGNFANRLLCALEAAQAAGGDSRGKQSATLLVVRERGGYRGGTDRLLDLRVDDHPEPLPELRRVFEVHQDMYADRYTERVPITPQLLRELHIDLVFLSILDENSPADQDSVLSALGRFAEDEHLADRLGNTESGFLDWLLLSRIERCVRIRR